MHVRWFALQRPALTHGAHCLQGVEEVITENIVVSAKAVLKGAYGQSRALDSRRFWSMQGLSASTPLDWQAPSYSLCWGRSSRGRVVFRCKCHSIWTDQSAALSVGSSLQNVHAHPVYTPVIMHT